VFVAMLWSSSTTLEAAVAEALIKKNPANAPKSEKSFRTTQRTCTACAGVRPPVRHAPCIRRWQAPALAMPYRPPYNCRHTYATICSMSNMNPAFIAQQLGHSVQMLLTTYARWLNSSSDWAELEKLQIGIKSVSGQKTSSNPLIGKVIDLHS
jgi:integrase